MTFARLGLLALCAVAGIAVVPAQLRAQSGGLYTAEQAASGATSYAANCSACHGAALEGGAGPVLAGKTFMDKWSGQTAADVYSIVSMQMPQTAPGSLSKSEYLALMAYLLQRNGYAAGSTALTENALASITLAPQGK